MDKVYCGECEFIWASPTLTHVSYCCYAPLNKKHKVNWLGTFFRLRRRPDKINKHNDCGWFKPKEEPKLPNSSDTIDCDMDDVMTVDESIYDCNLDWDPQVIKQIPGVLGRHWSKDPLVLDCIICTGSE